MHRKTTRLSRCNYQGQKIYFITICCDRRLPHLARPSTATLTLSILFICASKHNFLLHAYCAMPDHLHFLVQGIQPGSDALELIRTFKLRTAFHFRKQNRQRLWEMSYYDHILRRSDAIESVASYIWSIQCAVTSVKPQGNIPTQARRQSIGSKKPPEEVPFPRGAQPASLKTGHYTSSPQSALNVVADL